MIAVFVYLLFEAAIAIGSLADVLLGLSSGEGYVDLVRLFGWEALIWPVAVTEVATLVLLGILQLLLLVKFFRRDPWFSQWFLGVLVITVLAGLAANLIYSLFIPDFSMSPPGNGVVLGLGVYQYLFISPYARRVFALPEPAQIPDHGRLIAQNPLPI